MTTISNLMQMAGKMMKLLESLWKQANLETLPPSSGAAAAAASAKSKKPKSMFNKVVATCQNTAVLSLLALLVQKYEF